MAIMVEEQPFTLSELITPEDVHEMAVIGHDAFLDDTHTNLKKYLVPEQPESVDGSGIREWLDMPERCHVIKAVHNKTLEIMGYICWAHRGYIPRPPQPETTKGRFSDLEEPNEQRTKIQQMEDMEDEHFTTFMADIMPEGTKCWFVAGLTVAPKFHRMGVARALLRWGTQRAEADGVFAWVHSSELAWKAYEACGFEIVRVLKIDLDKYAEGKAVGEGPGARGKWGAYTIRYMVYKPHRVGDGGWEVKSHDEVEAMALS
ncbi:hypothetical protein NLG97_g6616 [Lecanicillium saksenae]|uniref:Uncharacterized protein n=1 Tax=Lecanicillium saksenae TaxID=468837 RepID=A0ACC1QQF2_9HYPO|nr:hypothetical protein NLG97_g6616 [Lecanicillium saksenae]